MEKQARQEAIPTADWHRVAGRIHTHESFGRAIVAGAIAIAARTPPSPDGKIRVKGLFTFEPLSNAGAGFSGCLRGTLCWEDEAAQQTVCEEREFCRDDWITTE